MEIYEFEKTELNSQEEMEKQARQYAEEQLEDMRVEMQRLLQAKNAQSQQILNMQQEFEGRQQEAQMHCDALKQEHTHLANTVAQVCPHHDAGGWLLGEWQMQATECQRCQKTLAYLYWCYAALTASPQC